MDDAERGFWPALEYRICREFEGFADRRLRAMWCDGLIPEVYDLQAHEPCIRGRAFCGPSGQETWQFALLIGTSVDSPEHIDWPTLLPANDMTGWLSPHPRERTLVLDPLGAQPDL